MIDELEKQTRSLKQQAGRARSFLVARDRMRELKSRFFVHRWEDFRWIPGARETVAAFNRAGWLVIVVTNQSGVGRGYYTEDERMTKASVAALRDDKII